MTSPEILAQLGGLHEMMRELLRGVPSVQANARFHPRLASLTWYLGRSVYRETYWLREALVGDADLTARVRHLFGPGDLGTQCAGLPPPEHLLGWAAQIQDEHLRRLATPGALPNHPLLAEDRLQWFLLQETARDYERMLLTMLARRVAQPPGDYLSGEPLRPCSPGTDTAEVTQGHYRIGSRDEPFAYDNELPPQAVELASFRIAKRPVSNAEYLAFLEAGGYREAGPWDEEGMRRLEQSGAKAPWHWRMDAQGHWYGMGINGPADLPPDEPVSGVGHQEAAAYAAWAAGTDSGLAGAVLQHEYQWEVAARSGLIEGTGRVWEWCANPFHPYPEFTPFPDASVSQDWFDKGQPSLRGASLHTQRCLRRASFRNWAEPSDRHLLTGIRLVLPPG
jgi:iron(II)-dependent oxidoreductase